MSTTIWKVESVTPDGKPFYGAHGNYPRIYANRTGALTAKRVQEKLGNSVRVYTIVGDWVELVN